jgi:di/tricarboxylate transporter
VLTVEQAFSGFGDQTVIFIASLFVVSEALDATGVTTWGGPAADRRHARPARAPRRHLLAFAAHAGSLLVLGPGGYRFGDYWRLGFVMLGLFFAVAVGLVPLIWGF